MLRLLVSVCLILPSACKPPATDDYLERVDLSETGAFASDPLPSPDTEGAVWADSQTPGRIIYGRPGEAPVMALACEDRSIVVTRFVPADAEARAMLALIGNGHVARLPVDAMWNGSAWLWRGAYPVESDKLEVLTGRRQVEATIAGAGTVILNPSERPARLVAQCREETINVSEEPQAVDR